VSDPHAGVASKGRHKHAEKKERVTFLHCYKNGRATEVCVDFEQNVTRSCLVRAHLCAESVLGLERPGSAALGRIPRLTRRSTVQGLLAGVCEPMQGAEVCMQNAVGTNIDNSGRIMLDFTFSGVVLSNIACKSEPGVDICRQPL
jgi:hypothetical protein